MVGAQFIKYFDPSCSLVGVWKLVIGSVFHTWMLKRAPAGIIAPAKCDEQRQASLAYRCDKAQVVSRLQTKVDWLDTNK